MAIPDLSVDLTSPITFNTDPSAAAKPYIAQYIAANPRIFKARGLEAIVAQPSAVVLKLKDRVENLISTNAGTELNNHILKGSPSVHWAAEVYQYIPETTKAWLSSAETPNGLDAIEAGSLSPDFGVYFCKVGASMYCGSGTAIADKPSKSGTLYRQNQRDTSRKSTNGLCELIKAAERDGEQVSWAQAMQVPGTFGAGQDAAEDDNEDLNCEELGELLHFRVLCLLAEQLLSTGVCAHATFLGHHNTSFWAVPPGWRGACRRTAWEESITGVATDEMRRAKNRVDGMTEEQAERKRKRERVEGMTEEQQEARNARRRVSNLTEEQAEKQRERRQVANLTSEQVETKRKRQRTENLNAAQLAKKRANDKVQNAKRKAARRQLSRRRMSELHISRSRK